MNIILIGFMGSGKTVVSKQVAKKLGMELVEMEDYVIARSGRKSANEVFDKDGEIRWRELEIDVAKDLADKDNCVISTGGGVVTNKIIIDYLSKNGYFIYLRTGFKEVKKRLENTNDRPLMRDLKLAKKIYAFRKPLYREYCDDYIRTDGKTIKEVTEEVIEKYGETDFSRPAKKFKIGFLEYAEN